MKEVYFRNRLPQNIERIWHFSELYVIENSVMTLPLKISCFHSLQILGTTCTIRPVKNTTTWSVRPTFTIFLLLTAAG